MRSGKREGEREKSGNQRERLRKGERDRKKEIKRTEVW